MKYELGIKSSSQAEGKKKIQFKIFLDYINLVYKFIFYNHKKYLI
jgi:hypothetical protein